MCYETDKIVPLAKAIKSHVPIHSRTRAEEILNEHIRPARGRRSEITNMAEQLYDGRRRLGFSEKLYSIRGDKLSALREAITMVLREQAGSVVVA